MYPNANEKRSYFMYDYLATRLLLSNTYLIMFYSVILAETSYQI